MDFLPLVATTFCHALFAGWAEAVHVAPAMVVLQFKETGCPDCTVAGFAVSVTGPLMTITVTDALPTMPPGPPQFRLNVVVAVRLVMTCRLLTAVTFH